jgi:mannose-6-phosphate isomerase-like protein (cupin superfamily)
MLNLSNDRLPNIRRNQARQAKLVDRNVGGSTRLIMETQYTAVWEFEVPAAANDEFLGHYGPNGSWAALFRQDPAYIDTQLLQDAARPGRYLTVDRWRSAQAYHDFRDRFAGQYEALDRVCGKLTSRETNLGAFMAPTGEIGASSLQEGGAGRGSPEPSANKLKPIDGYRLITPGELAWRPSNLMRIPNADFLERTGSKILGARLWRLPPKSANTLHKHVRAEEFYFVVEGVGRMRVGGETLTVPRLGGVLVGPSVLRQVFNDTDAEVLWLIVGAPEAELEAHEKGNMSLFYPVEPTQLPLELKGFQWPPPGLGKPPP